MSRRIIKVTLKAAAFFSFLLCAYTASALAQEVDDGFGSAEQIEGQYFTIYFKSQADVGMLLSNLDVGSFDKLLVGKSAEKPVVLPKELGSMLDTLYLRVSDLLDMHVYSFHGKIKVCKDYAQLSRIYRDLFGHNLDTHSFYVQELKTIYITEDNFKREILGHEIAHAIISSYFVVAAPVKIHEILARYVEYELRK
jgi:hypothetical protein